MTTNTTTTTITTTDNNEDYTSVVDLSLLDTSTGDINQTNQSNNPVAIVRMTQMEKLTSRQAFDERLKTFSPLTYYCKPTALSPIVCARFGWTNTSQDMLKCVSCKAALMVTIHPKIQNRSIVQKLIRAYQSKLATTHHPTCPFRFEAELYLVAPFKGVTKTDASAEDLGNKVDADNNSQSNQSRENPSAVENVVPPHFASILPRDVWEMIEQPNPLPLVQKRFQSLIHSIIQKDETETDKGTGPAWQFPPLTLPDDVLKFDGDSSDTDTLPDQQSLSRKNALLARLAFDRKHPDTSKVLVHENLLSRLKDVICPHASKDDEIRAQTRNQGAWDDLHECFVAFALFGWICTKGSGENLGMTSNNKNGRENGAFTLDCPVCLAKLKLQMVPYDRHHHHRSYHSLREASSIPRDQGGPPSKRRRLLEYQNEKITANPLSAHRYHCPYVCGFPKDGERKGTPIWQMIAAKMLRQKESVAEMSDNDGNGDAATNRLLRILQSGIATQKNRKGASINIV